MLFLVHKHGYPFFLLVRRNGKVGKLVLYSLRLLFKLAVNSDLKRAVRAEKAFEMLDIVVVEHLAVVDYYDTAAKRIYVAHIVGGKNNCRFLFLVEGVYKRSYLRLHRNVKTDRRLVEEHYLRVVQERCKYIAESSLTQRHLPDGLVQ